MLSRRPTTVEVFLWLSGLFKLLPLVFYIGLPFGVCLAMYFLRCLAQRLRQLMGLFCFSLLPLLRRLLLFVLLKLCAYNGAAGRRLLVNAGTFFLCCGQVAAGVDDAMFELGRLPLKLPLVAGAAQAFADFLVEFFPSMRWLAGAPFVVGGRWP